MTPDQQKLIDQYLDPNGAIEIPQALLDVMTPAEIAEVDQILASRFDLARGLLAHGKTNMAMRRLVHNIVRLDMILAEVRDRLHC